MPCDSVNGPDRARLMKTPNGEVVTLTEAPVPRLRIERPCSFAKTTLGIGKQVPGFPDVWGSQHDPKFDATEIDLAHSEGARSRSAVGRRPCRDRRGSRPPVDLVGIHQWAADFVVGR